MNNTCGAKVFFIVVATLMLTACANSTGLSSSPDDVIETSALQGKPITTLPHLPMPKCRSGTAKLYDECTNQLKIFQEALARAHSENKVLLVSYGAEWCIWCHVFAQYVKGHTSKFTYTYGRPDAPDAKETSTLHERPKGDFSEEARDLNAFVSDKFVLVHIDAQYAPNGRAVLNKTGADRHYDHGIPFVFTVSRGGKYSAHMTSKRVEIRRDTLDWYRGYNRAKLLNELSLMHSTAQR